MGRHLSISCGLNPNKINFNIRNRSFLKFQTEHAVKLYHVKPSIPNLRKLNYFSSVSGLRVTGLSPLVFNNHVFCPILSAIWRQLDPRICSTLWLITNWIIWSWIVMVFLDQNKEQKQEKNCGSDGIFVFKSQTPSECLDSRKTTREAFPIIWTKTTLKFVVIFGFPHRKSSKWLDLFRF